jgi:hypothetical protein
LQNNQIRLSIEEESGQSGSFDALAEESAPWRSQRGRVAEATEGEVQEK